MKCCRKEHITEYYYYNGQNTYEDAMRFLGVEKSTKRNDGSIHVMTDYGYFVMFPGDYCVIEGDEVVCLDSTEFNLKYGKLV